MNEGQPTSAPDEPLWLTQLVRAEPRIPLMGPYLAYLLLMMLGDVFPTHLQQVSIVLHVVLSFGVIWLFRRHYPPMGRPHLILAIIAGLLAAWLWVAGQHFFDHISVAGRSLGARLPLYPGEAKIHNPHSDYSDGMAFWSYAVLKITRACTAVPIVEELMWRGFLLRAFVSWDRFETVPYGQFAWRAMIGTALLSTIQHPDNWMVSIFCWLFFNALFYWTRSLWCLIVTHAVTNLVLYTYVLRTNDWRFW